jgi:hypothetical protein
VSVVVVAPHAYTALGGASALFRAETPAAELDDRVADWHDLGSLEAMEACARHLGCAALRPSLPRAVLDLNRGWAPRPGPETLFSKGAVDAWTRTWLAEGALERLQQVHHEFMMDLRAACTGARGLVETHSYGDLGSTYDRQHGGRPVRRGATAIVVGAPWAAAFPVGISRFIPANLVGTPWSLHRAVGDALAGIDLAPGPNPYPAQVPWALSARFLADRWFTWLGSTGQITAGEAERLADFAWFDELDEAPGVAASLAARLGEWTHDGADLGQRFLAETGCFTLVVELRIDLVARARDMGRALGEALEGWHGAAGGSNQDAWSKRLAPATRP